VRGQEQPFELSFNGRLRVDFQGARVTSGGGLLLVRELDERLGFGELIERHLTDGRARNTQLRLGVLVHKARTNPWSLLGRWTNG
jgi:hypothetical protein